MILNIDWYNKFLSVLYCALAFSIPFETYVNINLFFTWKPAHVLFLIIFLSVIPFWLLSGARIQSTIWKLVLLLILLLIGILWSFINAPMDIPWQSEQSSVRMLFNFLFLYFIFIVIAFHVEILDTESIILAFTFGVLISVGVELFQYIGEFRGIHDPGRYSVFGIPRLSPKNMPPNQYAMMTSMGLFFVFESLRCFKKKAFIKKKFFLFTSIILVLATLLTFSRSIWIGLLLAFFGVYLIRPRWISLRLMFKISMIIIFVPWLVGIYFNLNLMEKLIDRFSSVVNIHHQHNISRLEYWYNSIEMFEKHPIIGVGWANNLTPHNTYLQILSETGLLGFLIYISFILYILLQLIKVMKLGNLGFLPKGVTNILMGWFIITLFYLNTDIGFFQIQTWFTFGLIAAAVRYPLIRG